MKEWYSVQELLGTRGLPSSDRGITFRLIQFVL